MLTDDQQSELTRIQTKRREGRGIGASEAAFQRHAEKVKASGSGKFMERFYVGYGHQSIADCGSTTLFIEGVSMLAAKAIQDWPLYAGQEGSTRYIDMSKQPIYDPVRSKASQAIMRR